MGQTELLALLEEWGAAAHAVILHVLGCPTCRMAEALGGQGYCPASDRLWKAHREAERKIQDAMPEFRALGIDVDEMFRESGWQFWKEPQ